MTREDQLKELGLELVKNKYCLREWCVDPSAFEFDDEKWNRLIDKLKQHKNYIMEPKTDTDKDRLKLLWLKVQQLIADPLLDELSNPKMQSDIRLELDKVLDKIVQYGKSL